MQYIRFNNKYYKGFQKEVYKKIDLIKNKNIPVIESLDNSPLGALGAYANSRHPSNSLSYTIYHTNKTGQKAFICCLSAYYFQDALIDMLKLIEEKG